MTMRIANVTNDFKGSILSRYPRSIIHVLMREFPTDEISLRQIRDHPLTQKGFPLSGSDS